MHHYIELSVFFHVRASFDESPRCGVGGQIRAPLTEQKPRGNKKVIEPTEPVMKPKLNTVYLAGTSNVYLMFISISIIICLEAVKVDYVFFWKLGTN